MVNLDLKKGRQLPWTVENLGEVGVSIKMFLVERRKKRKEFMIMLMRNILQMKEQN
jgi:hypothetical protein